nr:hypothetical protein BaRGS_003271 [Batillaria attramentaria]
MNRILENSKLDKRIQIGNMNFDPALSAEETNSAKKQAQEQARSMSLNVVRLSFEVFLPDNLGQFTRRLAPVVSQPIYDSKDIAVRFVEHNEDGSVKWEAYGNFSPLDVHRQYAIVFKTPAYYNANIDKAVNVMIMLQRKTDCEVSEAKAFTYYPQNRDKESYRQEKKRKKRPPWQHFQLLIRRWPRGPIHLSIINNQTYALQQLLDVMVTLPNPRTTINAYNYVRQTALHLAAIMQQPYHIELLLHAGADPAMADRNGNTPAHLAVMNNSLEALQALVKYLRPGVTAAKPFPELNYLNYDGYTPVHLAAQSSNVDMLRLLVHGRANVDVPDGKSGRTALHHAVELDDLPVAGYLLMEVNMASANADVNARCFDGNTPLHIACCRGLVGMVALLMTAGANPEVENEEVPPEEDGDVDETEDGPRQFRRGLQPIDYAAGNERIVRVLKGDQSTGEERIRDPMDDLEEDSSVKDADGKTCDMDQLSYESRVELSVLLDPVHTGKDIFALADRLGYNNLVTALGVMGCSGTSPTRFLLDYHELIDRAAKSGVKTKPEFQHCQVDSGVISCN